MTHFRAAYVDFIQKYGLRMAMSVGLSLATFQASAQDVKVPALTLPPSSLLSPEAVKVITRQQAIRPPDFAGDIVAARTFWGSYNDARLAEMRAHFRTGTQRTIIGGVSVDLVTPAEGIPSHNAHRILINVHGGAFLWGAGSGALVEAIPIAATMHVKVVTVDYRLAPEHHYPAASQDITAVYAALLKDYTPGNIGIYGCSAGGIIAAQSIAWIKKEGLPRPGALGTFCGTGSSYQGDSAYLSDPLTSGAARKEAELPRTLATSYMEGIAPDDPVAYPLISDKQLAGFPPVLQIAGSRDFAASILTWQHRRLSGLGVASDLQIFDGLGHAFFMWPDMPESLEAYRLIAHFFDRHLGTEAAEHR